MSKDQLRVEYLNYPEFDLGKEDACKMDILQELHQWNSPEHQYNDWFSLIGPEDAPEVIILSGFQPSGGYMNIEKCSLVQVRDCLPGY